VEGMKQGGTHHPPHQTLERFVLGELSRAERREVVRHLLTDCRSCVAVTAPLWSCGAQPRQPRAPQFECHPIEERVSAMAAMVSAAQELLLAMSEAFAELGEQLEELLAVLPRPQPADPESEEVLTKLLDVSRGVLAERVRPAIADLRRAAYFPAEPPGEGSTGEEASENP
jgi:hypothetical protein